MMRAIVVGGGLASSVVGFAVGLLGQVPAGSMGEANITNLTALACLIGVLGFIVMKMLPDLHQKSVDQAKASQAAAVEQAKISAEAATSQAKTFAETVEAIQTKFSGTLDRIHERGIDATKDNTQELARLREHCATMHGTRPSGK